MKIICLTLNNIVWICVILTIILVVVSIIQLRKNIDVLMEYQKLLEKIKSFDSSNADERKELEELVYDLFLHDTIIFKLIISYYTGFGALISIIILLIAVIITLII